MPSPMSSTHDVIGIPLGTRLQSVVLVGGEVHIWMAVKCRGKDYADWQGSYMRVEPNGRVSIIRKDDAYDVDEEFVIKEAKH